MRAARRQVGGWRLLLGGSRVNWLRRVTSDPLPLSRISLGEYLMKHLFQYVLEYVFSYVLQFVLDYVL